MKKFIAVPISIVVIFILVISLSSAKVPDLPVKIDLATATRLKDVVSQVKAIQLQANQATQAISQIATAAAQPLIDELDEICKVGKFTIDDVVSGKVRVSKTGEITRQPVPASIESPPPAHLPEAPTKKPLK